MQTLTSRTKLDIFLEFLPGFLTWVVLLSPVWLGIFYPTLVAFFLTFLSIYWVYLAFSHTTGLAVGYKKMQEEMATDWFIKCKELVFSTLPDKETLPDSLEETKHLLLIPTVNESYEVLETTFQSLADQSFEIKENLFIVITCEERGAESVKESLEKLKSKFSGKIGKVLFYVHPANIPGELVGGGAANRTWGAKHAISELKERGFNLRNFIFTTFDADTTLHREFISRLTYAYLTNDKRDYHFYSTAAFLFNNNLWDVHTLMRIEANSVTLGTLSSWTIRKETIETFSCYSTSLDTLIAADFWDVALIDDTVFYWRAFFARKGRFTPVIFYTPNSSDAVHGETFLKAHKNLYKQLLRWGWGSVTTSLAFKGFLTDKNISFSTKLAWSINKTERHLIFRTLVFLITFGFTMLSIVNDHVRQTTIAYNLPTVMSTFLTMGLLFIVPGSIIRSKIVKPLPKNWPIWKKALTFLEDPLIIINLLTFSFIPFLEAETKMMLGRRYKSLNFTPKVRSSVEGQNK